MNHRYIVKSCVKTCLACPSQWDIKTINGRYIYARYRWGVLTLTLNAFTPKAKVIFSTSVGGSLDGCMSTPQLRRITAAVLDWNRV